jgi:hypothetical protein
MVSCKAKKTKIYQCDHCDKMFFEKRYALIHKKGRTFTQRGTCMPVIAEKHTFVHKVLFACIAKFTCLFVFETDMGV